MECLCIPHSLPDTCRSAHLGPCDIMRQTQTIQECIADPAKTGAIKEYVEKGRQLYQMQTFDQHLTDLYRGGLITLETAKAAASSASDFERNFQFE
jgi:twitching motility protein PilT